MWDNGEQVWWAVHGETWEITVHMVSKYDELNTFKKWWTMWNNGDQVWWAKYGEQWEIMVHILSTYGDQCEKNGVNGE